jgi:hypothetical protein
MENDDYFGICALPEALGLWTRFGNRVQAVTKEMEWRRSSSNLLLQIRVLLKRGVPLAPFPARAGRPAYLPWGA